MSRLLQNLKRGFCHAIAGRLDDIGSGGRVVTIKWGDQSRRIGIDGGSEAIKEAIRSAFGLRTKRPFWLEDNEEIVRSIDRDMPLKDYTLHLDGGKLTSGVCFTNFDLFLKDS